MIKPLTDFQASSVANATRRLNLWEGSVRSSKSVCADLRWLQFIRECAKQENDEPLAMLGKTERTLKRNVLDPIQKMVGPRRCKINMGAGEVRLFGQLVYIASANNELAVSKIQGLTLQGAYGDEVSTWPESVFRMLTSRLSLSDSQFFGTTNPDSPNHWLKKSYIDRATARLSSSEGLVTLDSEGIDLLQLHFILDDNPFLPAEFRTNLTKEYTGLWKLRYIDGLWVVAEGTIYGVFDPDLHVTEKERLGGSDVVIGIDYGTTNPFVALAIEIRPEGLHIFDELYIESPLTDSQLVDAVQDWLVTNQIDPDYICPDPSAASFTREMFVRGVHNLHKANNDVKYGLRRVASLLSQGMLTISLKCVSLLEEIPGYVWDPKAALKGEDAPLKVGDHCCDAMRYGIVTTERIWRNSIRGVV